MCGCTIPIYYKKDITPESVTSKNYLWKNKNLALSQPVPSGHQMLGVCMYVQAVVCVCVVVTENQKCALKCLEWWPKSGTAPRTNRQTLMVVVFI